MKGEVRGTKLYKIEITKYEVQSKKYEVQSTVAARLFASGIGASISHTCRAPLSSGEGPEVRPNGKCEGQSAMCEGKSQCSFPR